MEFLKKRHPLDKLLYGTIAGILGPLIGFVIYYILLFSHLDFLAFIETFMKFQNMQSPIISISLIFNLVLLYGVFRYNLTEFGRGIVLATFLYVPLVFILKFWQ
jgi:hypothetical protein